MTELWPPRPTLGASFYKAHGLGNDYLVFEEGDVWLAAEGAVARVCGRHRGVGADGIVALLRSADDEPFRLRMFNPDGSEFERSGNGLRILASFLARRARVDTQPFYVRVGGNQLQLALYSARRGSYDVSVLMGRATTGAAAVGLDAELLDSSGRITGPDGEALEIVPVSIGNPHVVAFGRELADQEIERLGRYLSAHPGLAHGANVQLAVPGVGRSVRALIWERGVGRTSASGTSACAVAVAAVVRGDLEPGPVKVEMDGGALDVTVAPDLDVTLRGPVTEVCEGELSEGLIHELARAGEA